MTDKALQWRQRRGMKELDVLLERYFRRHYETSPPAQQDAYREAIEAAGLRIELVRQNPYEFISQRAREASAKYGVKSVSLLARKEWDRWRATDA